MADKKIVGRRVKMPTYPIHKDFKKAQEIVREAGIKSGDIALPPSVTRSMTKCEPLAVAMPCGATAGTAPDPFEEEQLKRYSEEKDKKDA